MTIVKKSTVALCFPHLNFLIKDQAISAGNPEGKRPLGRPKRRWEDNKGVVR
jgi:hypothetical protein